MNQHALSLGMTGNPLRKRDRVAQLRATVTTARDLAILAQAQSSSDFPEYYELARGKRIRRSTTFKPAENRNSLLWRDDSVDGIKTGHTDEAGYCLVVIGQP